MSASTIRQTVLERLIDDPEMTPAALVKGRRALRQRAALRAVTAVVTIVMGRRRGGRLYYVAAALNLTEVALSTFVAGILTDAIEAQ